MASPFVKLVHGAPLAFDRAEARKALAALCDPQYGVQLHALPCGKYTILPGADLDGLVEEAARFQESGQNVYLILNPVPVGLGEAAKVGHVLGRRWLFIDIDPEKAEGFEHDPANEKEKEQAETLANGIWTWLYQHGWPMPIRVDSGNGAYLLYRIDLPNNDHAHAIIRAFLYALWKKYDGLGGKIDKAVHNSNRLARLPGSLNRKGNQHPDRPNRTCKITGEVREPVVVTAEQITEATALLAPKLPSPPLVEGAKESEPVEPEAPKAEANGEKQPFKKRVSSGEQARCRAYVGKAYEGELTQLRGASTGNLNTTLNEVAFVIGTLLGTGYCCSRKNAEQDIFDAAKAAGCDDPRKDWECITRAIDAGVLKPREIPDAEPAPKEKKAEATGAPEDDDVQVVIKASSITPRKIQWLWPGRIPLGKLTTFAGVGGLGKTFVLCDITARVTRGDGWPDSGGECQEAGKVLFVSGEDDPDDTLVPRLIELRADLNRVFFMTTEVQDCFTLGDLKTLDKCLEQAGEGVRFVAIDPPTAFLGGVDDHKNAELRGLLSPLKSWAQRNRVAVVFNTHVNKGGGKIEAMMRVMGSVAWVNAVRAAHIFSKDPEDHERRLFIGMKMNISRERKGLAYRINPVADDQATIEWLGEVDTTADDAVNNNPVGKSRKVVASEWLIDKFREKKAWRSDDLFREAKEAGISRSAVFEAKAKLELPRAIKRTSENGDITWEWWVPEDWQPLQQAGTTPDEEAFG